MRIAMIGLGKMGFNMTQRLLNGGHEVVALDRDPKPVQELVAKGAVGASDLADVVSKLQAPRVIWLMVPAGAPIDSSIDTLLPLLSAGDVIVDGGNSNFKESIARGERCAKHNVHFLDAGTSGGVWGLENGYCLMVGGTPEAFAIVEPAIATLAPPKGYLHAGPPCAGHYAKMIHNGIEYGMMQAYAEGFEILEKSRYDFDLAKISDLWMQGSVVRSWLLELAARAFAEDPHLEKIKGFVNDSGEGRWTVTEAMDLDVPAPVLTLSLQMRFRSRQEESFSAKVNAALRNQFGGHAVKTSV
ncbi:MAG: 6-phosphogluconate dehydrogenase, decarboxylating [Cyanobacteria bacterium RYN_339]|nr:6-phosphogluconate dehydrogenase, decarboxylating [Cyanobacteria bacterium RYN_339]